MGNRHDLPNTAACLFLRLLCSSEMSQGARRTDRFRIAHIVLIIVIPGRPSGLGGAHYLLILFGNGGETVGMGE